MNGVYVQCGSNSERSSLALFYTTSYVKISFGRSCMPIIVIIQKSTRNNVSLLIQANKSKGGISIRIRAT